MPKSRWGEKRECAECGTRFYDLNREPIVCPNCNAVYKVEKAAIPQPLEETTTLTESKTVKGDEIELDDDDELADLDIDDPDTDDDAGLIEDEVSLEEVEVSEVLDGAIDESKVSD